MAFQVAVKALACTRVILNRRVKTFHCFQQLAAYTMGFQVATDCAVLVAKQIVANIFEEVKMADIVRYGGKDLFDSLQDRSAHVVYQRNRIAVCPLDFS
jgi:hypothetical protein